MISNDSVQLYQQNLQDMFDSLLRKEDEHTALYLRSVPNHELSVEICTQNNPRSLASAVEETIYSECQVIITLGKHTTITDAYYPSFLDSLETEM